MPAAIVIVGLLLAFVALAAIDTGVALIVAISRSSSGRSSDGSPQRW